MTVIEEIKNELEYLVDQYSPLLGLLKVFESEQILKFGMEYQAWYTRALKLVQSLAPDRIDEFISYYRASSKRKSLNAATYVIQDYVNGYGPAEDIHGRKPFDEMNLTSIRLSNQFQILGSIRSRVGAMLADIRGALLAELEDRELEAARKLLSVSARAAGALSGVVLERHLQRVAESRNVAVKKKNPTISDLNDPLRDAGVYGLVVWRKIQYLTDIRNLCSHQKDVEPTGQQVVELIDGVNSVVKTVA
jgi:hypothetical protein